MEVWVAIVIAVVTFVVGIGLTVALFKLLPALKGKNAEAQAKQIIRDAEIKAERIAKNAEIDAKQAAFEAKQNAQNEIRLMKQDLQVDQNKLDIRDLAAGTTLYLPVEVAGALFSVGDTHAAQGDGEVCGTAIESPMDAVLTLDLVKGANLKTPRFTTPGPVTRHLDANGYEATTGIGPDLMSGARDAVAAMIDHLCATRGLSAVDAYMLCSTCGDLRISEIVDMPNWVVSFYFPRAVFE